MTPPEFLKRAHRCTGGSPTRVCSPASPRVRVVLRVLIALRDEAGEFNETDLWALDAEAQQLLTALLNDQLAGQYADPHLAAV